MEYSDPYKTRKRALQPTPSFLLPTRNPIKDNFALLLDVLLLTVFGITVIACDSIVAGYVGSYYTILNDYILFNELRTTPQSWPALHSVQHLLCLFLDPKSSHRDPSIQIVTTLDAKACKYYLR